MLTHILFMCHFRLQHTHTHTHPQRRSNSSFSHYSLPSFLLIISPRIAPACLSAALGFLGTQDGCLKHLLAGCTPPVITLGREAWIRDCLYQSTLYVGSCHLQILNTVAAFAGCSPAKLSYQK